MPSHPQHQGILYLLPRASDSAKSLLCGCSRKGCGGADACTGMCTCGTYNVYLWRGEEAITCPILQLSPYPSEKGSLSDSRAKPATMDFAATLHFHSSPLTGGYRHGGQAQLLTLDLGTLTQAWLCTKYPCVQSFLQPHLRAYVLSVQHQASFPLRRLSFAWDV